jgi:hypothetical protein
MRSELFAQSNTDLVDEICALRRKLDMWEGLRQAIADLNGYDKNWPSHGNAPLAIAASYALLKRKLEEANDADKLDVCAERAGAVVMGDSAPGQGH